LEKPQFLRTREKKEKTRQRSTFKTGSIDTRGGDGGGARVKRGTALNQRTCLGTRESPLKKS